jgi:hypothetical protein
MSESRESRSFGLNLDWNAIYENNFEPTNFFTIRLQALVPVVLSAVVGLIFGPFYQVSYYDFQITFILYFRFQHPAARGQKENPKLEVTLGSSQLKIYPGY